jgi:hypothetical protein
LLGGSEEPPEEIAELFECGGDAEGGGGEEEGCELGDSNKDTAKDGVDKGWVVFGIDVYCAGDESDTDYLEDGKTRPSI